VLKVWECDTVREPQWFAVHTRAKHERRVQRELESRIQLTTFLPVLAETHQWSDRKKRIEVPLFSSYLFIHAIYSPEFRQSVLRSQGILGFVGIGGQGLPIPSVEIESVRQLISAMLPVCPYPFVNQGQRVRIRGGALDNVEGIVVTNEGRKLVVSVDMISRSVAIQLEGCAYELEPVGERHFLPRPAALAEAAWR
jgi:transcription antitermination factor NusG